MRVVLATGERFAGCLATELVRSGHEILAVFSPYKGVYDRQFESMRFWLYDWRGWDIQKTCRKFKIQMRSGRLDEGSTRAFLRSMGADLLIMFGWPHVVPRDVRLFFKHGAMNIHPSLLPKLRGADPLFEILDKGLYEDFGVSFHRATDHLDAGPIYWRTPLKVPKNATYDALYLRLLDGIRHNLGKALQHLASHPAGEPQEGEPSFIKRFKKEDRVLNPHTPLQAIRRRTLACTSHHSRISSCRGQLITFSRCHEAKLENDPEIRNGTIVKRGFWSLTIRVADGYAKLGALRFLGHSLWKTPFFLLFRCRLGWQLAPAQETIDLLKTKGLAGFLGKDKG